MIGQWQAELMRQQIRCRLEYRRKRRCAVCGAHLAARQAEAGVRYGRVHIEWQQSAFECANEHCEYGSI